MVIAVVALSASLIEGTSWAAAPFASSAAQPSAAVSDPVTVPFKSVCAGESKPGWASCLSMVRTNLKGHRGRFAASTDPSSELYGYGPPDLKSAYNLPSSTAGSGATVAVVDAYDDPSAEADLQVYRAQYGLPACTTANGCFSKVAQDGSTNYPVPDASWAEEESLDVDMVSAVCPNCHILLVEADSSSIEDLGAAVDEAVALGAQYVSNSYGAPEDPSETADDSSYYDHPGVVITAGFYELFSPAGSQRLTAAAPYYVSGAATATVTAGAVTTANLTMQAGQLTVTPGAVSQTAVMGASATQNVTFTDTGQAPANVSLYQNPGGATQLTQRQQESAPVRLVRGTFTPGSLRKLRTSAKSAATSSAIQGAPASAPWASMTSYPLATMDDAAATDPATGLVYTVGGIDPNTFEPLATGYVYSPRTQAWTALPPMENARQAPQAAFIGGKLYVTGGWDINGVPIPQTEVYDPVAGAWSALAPDPAPYAGAGVAVLNGEMYVIGGCDAITCGHTDVEVYDPAANTWSAAGSYPRRISWEGCGAIAGRLYCAGGTTDTTDTNSAYTYDPAANTWSAIAPVPADLWGMGYTAANDQLLLSGGVTDNSAVITNQGFGYDPLSGSWTALPPSGDAVYRGASACGFYRIGGSTAGFAPQDAAEQLPGYTGCGAPVPWLSPSQNTFTLAPGASVTVTVSLNAGDPSITQPGAYSASLVVASDTPYQVSPIPVTLNATPPATWGKITGTVTGLACTGTVPLPGATVQIDTAAGDHTLKTDANGDYALWLSAADPLTLITSLNGWQPQAAVVTLSDLTTTTRNFALKPDKACA